MSASTINPSAARLTGFAAASLWHRRMAKTGGHMVAKVQPRLCAELVLHPLPRERGEPECGDPRRSVHVFHTA